MVHGRRGEGKYIKVPKGYIWVVGDNLSNSTDSRHYGPVPLAMVKGKVLARVSHLPNWATGACLPGGYVHFVLMEPDLAESD
jgi:hypothetical protein